MRFEEWMTQVNEELFGICGVSSEDLEDYTYRDLFEAGCSPESAARDALDWSGFEEEHC